MSDDMKVGKGLSFLLVTLAGVDHPFDKSVRRKKPS